jgi:NADH:ubiquinone oxidoreductase subunit F (NADH-binding)
VGKGLWRVFLSDAPWSSDWSAGKLKLVRSAELNITVADAAAGRLVGGSGLSGPPGLGLRRALSDPTWALDKVAEANVRGRGGADFPTARKWRSARAQPGPRIVIANGGEHEPGSAKDAYLLAERPDLVVEGLCIATAVVNARRSYIALASRLGHLAGGLQSAIDALCREGLDVPAPEVVIGPDDYLVGEETALIEVLEGKAAKPRFRPPMPSIRGYLAYPTVVNNVETLANVAWALRNQLDDSPGPAVDTFLWTVWGRDRDPVVGEARFGISIGQLLMDAGVENWDAVTLGGYSGGAISATEAETPMDPGVLAGRGLSLGCASFSVLRPGECPGRLAEDVLAFFAGASCGQCLPCEVGLRDAWGVMRGQTSGKIRDVDDMMAFLWELKGRGICRLPDGGARTVTALWERFEKMLRAHQGGLCGCSFEGEV